MALDSKRAAGQHMHQWRLFAAHVLVSVALAWSLGACTGTFTEVRTENEPISVRLAGEIDGNEVYGLALERVRAKAPTAYFRSLSLFGSCHDLPDLRGRMGFQFLQVRGAFFWQQVVEGHVNMDLTQDPASMSVLIRDVSDQALWLNRGTFPGGRAMRDAASIAQRHIATLGVPDCRAQILLSGFKDDEQWWWVTCRPQGGRVAHGCNFTIWQGVVGPPRTQEERDSGGL